MIALMITFSRAVRSMLKPTPSSMKGDTLPLIRTSPESTPYIPARHLSSVLLPLPLRPTMPKNSPSPTSKSTSFSARSSS